MKQLLLGLAGLVAAIMVGSFFFGGSGEDTRIVPTPMSSGDPEAAAEGLQARRPGSLKLGAPGAAAGDGAQAGSDRGTRSREALDGYRQAHRPRLGGTSPQHGAANLNRDGERGPDMRSQLADAEPLTGGAAGPLNGGASGGSARAPVDDWPADAPDVIEQPEPRQPEEGEVLSLFDGDPVASEAEAAIAKDVKIDEDGASFSADSQYAVPMAGRMSGEAGTISFWVRPDGEASDFDNASLVQLRSQNEWANRLQIWKDGGNVRLVFADGSGIESGATYGSEGWATDEWRLVTATWGEGMTALYVNGQLAGTSQYETPMRILPGTMLHVSSNYSDDPRSLTGAVSQFRVYNRPLNPDEVSTLSSQYPE